MQRVAAALTEALPIDVDHVLIQADLTIVAPGPLVASAARSLRLPLVATNGGGWRLDGETVWHSSGDILSNLNA